MTKEHRLELEFFTTSLPACIGCVNEQVAAGVLGYTEVSWDNFSGKEPQPSSADKYWAQLTDKEKAAARVLGYTGKIWDNESGAETQPTSASNYWADLRVCGENCLILYPPLIGLLSRCLSGSIAVVIPP